MNEAKLYLKPCPFCGGAVYMHNYKRHGDHYSVRCLGDDCRVCPSIYDFPTEEEAAAFWNRRAPLPDNKALTVECCGTCGHCDPGDGAPYCDNLCSTHYTDFVSETDGCMWYKRRPPEKGSNDDVRL